MKKVRRYNGEEDSLVMEQPGSGMMDDIDDETLRRNRKSMIAEDVAAPSTFGQAFKEARARNDKTFEWNGKKYTTELAAEKKATPKASAPAPAPTPRAVEERKSIYDTSRDPLVQKIKERIKGSSERKTPTLQPFSEKGVNRKTLLPMARGGKASASSRGDGIAQRGKTRGKMV